MAKILISPSKYLQGAGEMKNIGTYAAKCGKKALVLISQGGYKRIGKMIEEKYPDVEVEINCGGQPIYYFVISVE